MRVLLWNLGMAFGGGADKVQRIRAALEQQAAADVLVLNEYVEQKMPDFLGDLRKHGWEHVEHTFEKDRRGCVAICSRIPFSCRPAPAGTRHRCIVVDFDSPAELTMWAAYAPFDDKGGEMAPFWDAVLGGLANDAQRDTLLIGDLNCGRPGYDLPESMDLDGNPSFERLTRSTYEDLWRRAHGAEARDCSYYVRKVPPTCLRIDHAFGSPTLAGRLRSCTYRHEERDAGTSDHSMLVLDLEKSADVTTG